MSTINVYQVGRSHRIESIRNNWKKLSLSTFLVALLGVWLVSRSPLQSEGVWQAIEGFGWKALLFAFAGSFSQILFVILRYFVMTPREKQPGFRHMVYSIGLGHTLNTFFPVRAGDVLKCFLLSQGAMANQLTVLCAAGVVVADRVVDIATLLFMTAAWRCHRHPKIEEWLTLIPASTGPWIGMVALVGLALLWVFLFRGGAWRARQWSKEFRSGLYCLIRPRWLSLGLVFAFLSWSSESFALWVLTAAQGTNIGFDGAVFLVVGLNLALSVPVSLANVGPFEAAITLALTTFGLEFSAAFAVAAVYHGIQFLSNALWALLALSSKPKLE